MLVSRYCYPQYLTRILDCGCEDTYCFIYGVYGYVTQVKFYYLNSSVFFILFVIIFTIISFFYFHCYYCDVISITII